MTVSKRQNDDCWQRQSAHQFTIATSRGRCYAAPETCPGRSPRPPRRSPRELPCRGVDRKSGPPRKGSRLPLGLLWRPFQSTCGSTARTTTTRSAFSRRWSKVPWDYKVYAIPMVGLRAGQNGIHQQALVSVRLGKLSMPSCGRLLPAHLSMNSRSVSACSRGCLKSRGATGRGSSAVDGSFM
jgi:hypothetical protein